MANPGKPFLLDSSITDTKAYDESVRTDVELNRIQFEFPSGFASIPLIEECRALDKITDFDLMFDITMQMLVEKPVIIWLKNYKTGRQKLAEFVVTDRYMDLRGVEAINNYPILVNWLVNFVSVYLSKKYPRPSLDPLPAKTEETPRRKSKEQQSK